MKACKRMEGNKGSGGLPPEKTFKIIPSRASEHAVLHNKIEIALIINIYAEKEK